MNKTNLVLAVLGLGLAALQGPAVAGPPKATPAAVPRYGVVAGVDLDAVPWPEFCAAVQPVTVTRGGVTCRNVYPTSSVVQPYVDFSGKRPNAPPLDCDMLGREFASYTTPNPPPAADPWAHCRHAFTSALRARVSPVMPYNDMPLADWRAKYFGGWLVPGAPK